MVNSSKQFQEYIEKEILEAIKELSKKEGMTKERLQEIARFTLQLIHESMTLPELYENMIQLDDKFPELSPVIGKIIKEYLEKYQN